jgi:hypothetical protein
MWKDHRSNLVRRKLQFTPQWQASLHDGVSPQVQSLDRGHDTCCVVGILSPANASLQPGHAANH